MNDLSETSGRMRAGSDMQDSGMTLPSGEMATWSETIIRCGGNENSSTDEALRKIPKGISKSDESVERESVSSNPEGLERVRKGSKRNRSGSKEPERNRNRTSAEKRNVANPHRQRAETDICATRACLNRIKRRSTFALTSLATHAAA